MHINNWNVDVGILTVLEMVRLKIIKIKTPSETVGRTISVTIPAKPVVL